MKALQFTPSGGIESLHLAQVQDPAIQPNEVLIAVVAGSLNRADLLQITGNYPGYGKAGEIPGLDLAGTVIEIGSEVDTFTVGDNVCALVDGGALAQLAAVPAEMCLRLPRTLSFTKAAAVPEVFIVAHQALDWLGSVRDGSHVLFNAGASGVGTSLIQLAKRRGCLVHVAASPGKHARLLDLGADYCIDYQRENLAAAVLNNTNGLGAELIIDFVGAAQSADLLDAASLDGVIVLLGLLGGATVDQFSLGKILSKRLTLVGSTLRNREFDYKAALVADFRNNIWPGFGDGSLYAVVDTIFDWEDAKSAFKYMRAGSNVGKIVITVGE